MKIQHISKNELSTKTWAGGSTTQLYIYPENSSYIDRNFLIRISTATIETEESLFTKLPGIYRKLMILDGEIQIEHTGNYSKTLKQFNQYEFWGDWETKSYGKAIDFNLMTLGQIKSNLEGIALKSEQLCTIECSSYNLIIAYIIKGNCQFSSDNFDLNASKGDVVIFSELTVNERISLYTQTETEIVICKIVK